MVGGLCCRTHQVWEMLSMVPLQNVVMMAVHLPQSPQDVEALLGLLGDSCGVGGPGQELGTADSLDGSAIDGQRGEFLLKSMTISSVFPTFKKRLLSLHHVVAPPPCSSALPQLHYQLLLWCDGIKH